MKYVAIILLIIFICSGAYASSSANYKIAAEVFDSGAAIGSSTSYKLLYKSQASQITALSSANFNFSLGFMRSAYFSRAVILAPIVTFITPARGTNNALVNITDLAGANFRTGAKVKLSKASEADIIADNIVVESAAKITCRFNIVDKSVGLWDVVVINDDNQSATLPQGFKIESPTVQITGPVESTEMPFNPAVKATSIKYTLSKETNIIVAIFNMRGEKIWERAFSAGESGAAVGLNSVAWDGLTDFRSTASFGVYIVIISTKENGSVKELGRTKIAVVK